MGIDAMMRRKTEERKHLSPAEWQVMRIVWELGEGAARDIYTVACKRHNWAVDTVKTMLRRLAEKGILRTRQVGNCFLYTPAISAVKMLRQAADDLLANAVSDAVGPLVMHIVRSSRLSEDDMRELRTILERKEC